jgi:hypothetical protein
MANVAPVRISKSNTKTGRVCRVTIPKILLEDDGFPLDMSKQIYIRIVRGGLLITNNSNGNGTWTA